MNIEIKLYTDDMEASYNNFLKASKISMFYHSLSYRKLLKKIFTDCEDFYFCAVDGEKIYAILPVFIKLGKFGNVINSLPFFGSNGGIIYIGEKLEKKIKLKLFKSLDELCKIKKAFSCTIIEPPFEKDKSIYKSFESNLIDTRIGQFTELPKSENELKCEENLFKIIHPKHRNSIRKGLKSNFEISIDNSKHSINEMYKLHGDNMRNIGGLSKKKIFFDNINSLFKPNDEYRIYIAKYNGELASSLLIFYYKDMVEYYCPSSKKKFKEKNPLSVLIYKAMKDSILEKKSLIWNWGGTWLSQKGVYNFKSRWGTVDFPYKYHIKTSHNIKVEEYSAKELFKNYENFYSLPFSLCKK